MSSRAFQVTLDSLQPDLKSGRGMQQYAQQQAKKRLIDQVVGLHDQMQLDPLGGDPYFTQKVEQWRKAREKATGRAALGEQPTGVDWSISDTR